MNKEDIEQSIYERTRRFVSDDVMDAIAYMIGAEREACAKVCEDRVTNESGMQREDYENRQCAAAIRARGQA